MTVQVNSLILRNALFRYLILSFCGFNPTFHRASEYLFFSASSIFDCSFYAQHEKNTIQDRISDSSKLCDLRSAVHERFLLHALASCAFKRRWDHAVNQREIKDGPCSFPKKKSS